MVSMRWYLGISKGSCGVLLGGFGEALGRSSVAAVAASWPSSPSKPRIGALRDRESKNSR